MNQPHPAGFHLFPVRHGAWHSLRVLGCALLGVIVLLPSPASCRSYEIEQHRDWASWIESSSRDQIWAAAATITDSSTQRILLEVNYLPDACGAGAVLMTIPMFGYTDAPFSANGAIRVDRNPVIETVFTIEPHPDGIRITISDDANERLLRDARQGANIRIKIETEGDKEPLFLRFSLSGFTVATTRAIAMCQRIEQVLTNEDDSSFFDAPAPAHPTAPANPAPHQSPRQTHPQAPTPTNPADPANPADSANPADPGTPGIPHPPTTPEADEPLAL